MSEICIDYSLDNIPVDFFDAGNVKYKIKLLYKIKQVVLVEVFTGNVYKYHAVNYLSKDKKYLFFTKQPIDQSKHEDIAEKIMRCVALFEASADEIKPVNDVNNLNCTKEPEHFNEITIDKTGEVHPVKLHDTNNHKLLERIFKDILPRYGFAIRESQIKLADIILDALQECKISLCEAEVGTGKTHAYVIAAILNKLNNKNFNRIRTSYPLSNDFYMTTKMPAVISTSSIALQKAIAMEYLPAISKVFMDMGIIDKALTGVIRKGKEHFVCDKRLDDYLHSLSQRSKAKIDEVEEQQLRLIKQLNYLEIDLDQQDNLSNYVKSRICVTAQCNSRCSRYTTCRYHKYLQYAKSYNHDFQICNHNYFIADMRHRSKGLTPLIPNYQAVIVDEAHKFINAARQMYGSSIQSDEIFKVVSYINKLNFNHEQTALRIKSYTIRLSELNRKLFEDLKKPLFSNDIEDDTERLGVKITLAIAGTIRSLLYCLESLEKVLDESTGLKERPGSIYRYILRVLKELIGKFKVFDNKDNIVYWLDVPGGDVKSQVNVGLSSIPKDMDKLIYKDFWCRPIPMILTSGTMSVNGCFSHIKRNTGIDFVIPDRVSEISKKSPFDYKENSLLYISNNVPFPDGRNPQYIRALAEEVERLIKTTHGHSLVLFTSYKVMELVFNIIVARVQQFPLFKMGKKVFNPIDTFRKSKNGVLFASGNCWEGIDIPGDILSSLIIVKLPFAVPDPISEYEQTLFESVDEYKDKVIIPEMIIKLKQGVGRLIRTESDTGVISILDSRIRAGGSYRDRVLKALPECKITDSIISVEQFIREKKNSVYYM